MFSLFGTRNNPAQKNREMGGAMAFNQQSVGNSGGRDFAKEARPGWSVWEDACRSPDSWSWTDQSQISLLHSPTPPKCSTRVIMALINNLRIVYHQYCSSSYLDYFRLRQRKPSSNLIPTRAARATVGLPTDSDESPKAPSTLNSPSPMQSL